MVRCRLCSPSPYIASFDLGDVPFACVAPGEPVLPNCAVPIAVLAETVFHALLCDLPVRTYRPLDTERERVVAVV